MVGYPVDNFSHPMVTRSSSSYDSMYGLYLATTIESGAFVMIYVVLSIYVLCQVKLTLHIGAYVTMLIFLGCGLSNVVCFARSFYVESDDEKKKLIEMPTIVASGLITGVLIWYTFQMKVVLIKVQSENPAICLNNIYKAKIVMVTGLFLLSISYSLEIFENLYLEDPQYVDKLTDIDRYIIVITNRALSLITEFPLIFFQVLYIRSFLKIKYADGGFRAFQASSMRTKCIIIWIFTILLVNMINTVAFNVIQVIIRIK